MKDFRKWLLDMSSDIRNWRLLSGQIGIVSVIIMMAFGPDMIRATLATLAAAASVPLWWAYNRQRPMDVGFTAGGWRYEGRLVNSPLDDAQTKGLLLRLTTVVASTLTEFGTVEDLPGTTSPPVVETQSPSANEPVVASIVEDVVEESVVASSTAAPLPVPETVVANATESEPVATAPEVVVDPVTAVTELIVTEALPEVLEEPTAEESAPCSYKCGRQATSEMTVVADGTATQVAVCPECAEAFAIPEEETVPA
jgi:hypothetical protein